MNYRSLHLKILIFTLLSVYHTSSFADSACQSDLVSGERDFSLSKVNQDEKYLLLKKANQFITQDAAVVETLTSAGVVNKNNPEFLATRKAFSDISKTSLVALAYLINKEPVYLDYLTRTLIRWAKLNKPTGHPINETRLEGLIWTYSLICSYVEGKDRQFIERYFNRLFMAKERWVFGKKSKNNNHKTHHLKMLLLLSKTLGSTEKKERILKQIKHHEKINILVDGSSIDYHERDAMFYHVYNLEAWLEIELISQCCTNSVVKSFQYAEQKIQNNEINNEFQKSTAKLDKQRGDAGFSYAKRNGIFDKRRFVRSHLVYQTMGLKPSIDFDINRFSKLTTQNKFYSLRKALWKTI